MKNRTLTLGSLFDGSGSFPFGGILSGIEPKWASEVEPFPVLVTNKRLPQVKHYGDVSALSGADLEPVDIITFGSPCQDMSIAGRRAGLDGERSGLFHQAIRIIKEMREKTHGEYPRYCVWENVPGAFSSNGGDDFKAVLEAVIGVKEEGIEVPAPADHRWPKADVYLGDGWSVAYRVLDAQYWGVPQRRARIYLVADFAGGSAPEVLFKSEGLSGYSPEGFEAWKRAARNPESRPGTAGGTTACVTPRDNGALGAVPAAIALEHHPIDSRIGIDGDNIVQTLTERMGTGGNNVPLVMTPEGPMAYTLKVRCGKEGGGKGALVQEEKSATLATSADQALFQPQAFGISSDQSHAMLSPNPHAGIYEAETSRTLDAQCGHPGCNQGGIAVVEKAYSLQGNMIGRSDGNGPQGKGVGEDVAFTLDATDRQGVAAPVYSSTVGSYMTASEEVAQTLMARDYKDPQIVNTPCYIVRRLTPTECARLQGFPDWWCRGLETPEPTEEDVAFWMEVFETHRRVISGAKKPKTRTQIVKWLKNPHLDSSEYRLWGNGICLSVAWFVLAGIVYCDQLDD